MVNLKFKKYMSSKKIIRMSAGLANRMLQYSYALYLKKLGYDVYVDNNYKGRVLQHENFDWNRIFPNAELRQASKTLIFKYGGSYTTFDKIRRHYLPFTCSVWLGESAVKIPSDEELNKFNYFIGVYQNAKISESVTKEVRQLFKFSDFEKGSNNAIMESKMRSENSVAIHLRKGKDYMKNEAFANTCPLEYYQEAVEIIKKKVDNPVFYVFTDNPVWVKENLTGIEYTLVEGNPAVGWGNHYDMQLMSCCKHNIIANSTYSWWGAFLNDNPDKIVIDPKYWFNPMIEHYRKRENNTACEGWIII